MILLEIEARLSENDFILSFLFIGIVNAKRTPAIVGCIPDLRNKNQIIIAKINPISNEYFRL